MNRIPLLKFQFALSALLTICGGAYAQAPAPTAVPIIDGALGPCSADFTVTDSSGTPVYNAKIKVHIAYGFLNARKLDLEIGTNSDGKARFTGLPNRLKRGLDFDASQADQEGSAFLDPSTTCKAQLSIALHKKTP